MILRKLQFKSNKGVFSFKEILIVVLVAVAFFLIIIYDDSSIRPNIQLKTCIANMKKLHDVTKLLIMEEPDITDITVQTLLDKNILKKIPVCPSFKIDGRYEIIDEVGQPVDVICIHGKDKIPGHGSFLSLKAKYIDKVE